MNKIRIAGAAAGVVLVSGVVLQVSSAAFTGTTENANSWEAGTVYLSDSQNGTAMFSSATEKIVPGYSAKKCMTVTYDGTVDPSAALSFAGDVTANTFDAEGNGLEDDIDITVEMGPAGSSCLNGDIVDGSNLVLGLLGGGTTELHNGTLQSLEAAGVISTTWTPDGDAAAGAASRTRPFRFTVAMPGGAGTPNDAQGDTASATFSWSATAGT